MRWPDLVFPRSRSGPAPASGRRRLWRSTRRLLALGAGTLLAEAAYAVLRPVPDFDEHDPSGQFGAESAPKMRVAVIGDSSCTGPGLDRPDQVWSSLVSEQLAARGHRVVLSSFARGGATSADVLADQLPSAEAAAWDLAFLSVGTNDIIHQVPLATLEANLDQITERLLRVSRIVMLAGIGDLGTVPRLLPPIRHLASRRGQQADRVHARVADRRGALKAEMWGAAAEIFRREPGIFSADLFHPTAAGHRVWADAAWQALEPHLDRLESGAGG